MEDLIRRSDAIKVAKSFLRNDDEWFQEALASQIRMIPSAESTGDWISCNERLPEEGEIVLVQFNVKGHRFSWEEQRYIEFGRISSDREDAKGIGWEWLNESGADYWEPDYGNLIVAWMPLPKPWKGADDGTR